MERGKVQRYREKEESKRTLYWKEEGKINFSMKRDRSELRRKEINLCRETDIKSI